MQETSVRFMGWEVPLEKGMEIHSSILAWRTPWAEKPGGLQSLGSQRVRHDWATNTHNTQKQMAVRKCRLFVGFLFFVYQGEREGNYRVWEHVHTISSHTSTLTGVSYGCRANILWAPGFSVIWEMGVCSLGHVESLLRAACGDSEQWGLGIHSPGHQDAHSLVRETPLQMETGSVWSVECCGWDKDRCGAFEVRHTSCPSEPEMSEEGFSLGGTIVQSCPAEWISTGEADRGGSGSEVEGPAPCRTGELRAHGVQRTRDLCSWGMRLKGRGSVSRSRGDNEFKTRWVDSTPQPGGHVRGRKGKMKQWRLWQSQGNH